MKEGVAVKLNLRACIMSDNDFPDENEERSEKSVERQQ